MSDISDFREALYTALTNALSDNAQNRKTAESELKTLEIVDDFAIHLIDIALQKDVPCDSRLMAAIVLKQYIENYWNAPSDIAANCSILTSLDIRMRIQSLLFGGLREPNNKIRNAFAHCLTTIGSADYPDRWPSFFADLLKAIHTVAYDKNCVSGVIRVYEELIPESANRTSSLYPPIIDHVCAMIEDRSKYDSLVRMNFLHVLAMIMHELDHGHEETYNVIQTKLPALHVYFLEVLQAEDHVVSDYALKTSIIRFLSQLVHKMAAQIEPYMNTMLPTVWRMVMNYGDAYVKTCIYFSGESTNLETDEGRLVGFTPLVLGIFDLIYNIVESSTFSRVVCNVLTDILYYIFIFMQITKQMEERWANDELSFIEDESNECFDSKVRVTAREVLMMICNDYDPEIVFPALYGALRRHLTEAENCKNTNPCYWWKITEVCMFVIGLIKNIVLHRFRMARLEFDLLGYLNHWQLVFHHLEYPLLVGRALWLGATYSTVLSNNAHANYLQTTLNCLRATNHMLKLQAFRAATVFCVNLTYDSHRSQLEMTFPTILECIAENLNGDANDPRSDFYNVSHILFLNINLALMIVNLHREAADIAENKLSPMLVNVFLKHNSCPKVMYILHQILKHMLLNTEITVKVQEHFIPVVAELLITNDAKKESQKGVAMDVMRTLIRYAHTPLGNTAIYVGFPATVKTVLQHTDETVLRSGSECLRSFINIDVDQVLQYRDSISSGVTYVLRAINNILENGTEEASRSVGRLIIALIHRAGGVSVVQSCIHMILKAILSKMQRIEKYETWESLLIVFCYLFHTQMDAIMNFLTSIPGPTGVSALEYVLVQWMTYEFYFNGKFERTISLVAMTDILEYYGKSTSPSDEGVFQIKLKYECEPKLINNCLEATWIEVPLLAKVFKIIILETTFIFKRHNIDCNEDPSGEASPSISDSSVVCEEDSQCESEMLFPQDPLYEINLLEHFTQFLRKFMTLPRFEWFFPQINDKEKEFLRAIGVYQ